MSSSKKIVIIIFLLCLQNVCIAQSAEQGVISVAGDFSSTSSGSLSWTVGEVMTETYQSDKGYFTQGFHQPSLIIVTGLEAEKGIFMYPNPVRETLHLKIVQPGDYTIELFDLKGVRQWQLTPVIDASGWEQRIDVQYLAIGLYLLRIVNNSISSKTYSYRIEKI